MEDWRILRTACKEIKVEFGKPLEMYVKDSCSLFYLKSGMLKVKRKIDGKFFVVGKVKENNFFGEFLFFNDEQFEIYETITEVSIDCFRKDKLLNLLFHDKNLAEKLFILLCSKIARRFYKVKSNYKEDTNTDPKTIKWVSTPRPKTSTRAFSVCESIGIGFNELVKEFDCTYKKKSSVVKVKGKFFLFKSLCAFYSKIFGMTTKIVLPFSTLKQITPVTTTSFSVITKTKMVHTFEVSEENKNNLFFILNQLENFSRKTVNFSNPEILKGHSTDLDITEEEREKIFSVATHTIIKKNDEYIVKQGDYSQTIYYINNGSCKAVKQLKDSPKVINIMDKEEFFGDLSFLFGGSAFANVLSNLNEENQEILELFIFEKQKLQNLFNSNPILSPKFYFHLASKISKRWMQFLDKTLKGEKKTTLEKIK